MGDKASAPPPPDTSRYSDRQMDLSYDLERMGREMWDWAQTQQQTLGDAFQRYLGMAMPAMEEQFGWARDMRQRYSEDVVPQIQSLFAEAEKYASPAEEARQRAAAIQDTRQAAQAQREAQLRKLESYGIDPSETRYQALDKQAGLTEAAMGALAANQAGERTKQIGRDLRRDAINVGTGFLTDAQNAYTSGANLGISGINAGTATTQAQAMAQQGALPFYNQAQGANLGAAGIVNQDYQNELAYAADQREAESNLGGLGGLVGMGASFIPGVGQFVQPVMGMLGGGNEDKQTGYNTSLAATGGEVQAPGGPTSDGGVIGISDGEYVIPADVVRKMGTNYFDKMIERETGRAAPGKKQAIPVGG